MFGSALLQGMSVTAKNLVGSYFDKDRMTTIEYPEERKAPAQNYRNFPFLVFDKDADHLRCVACKICETECPPQCIYIEVLRDENGKVLKQPKVFDIDFSVCMGCQICVEACPFDAIKMDHEYELSSDNRFRGLLVDKRGLARSNEYYHSIKPIEAAEVDAHLAADAAKKKKPATPSAAVAKPSPQPAPASVPPPSPSTITIPADAPFSPEQREWLGKFLSQISMPEGTRTQVVPNVAAHETETSVVAESADEESVDPDLTNDVAWHDPEKDLAARMNLVKGKSLPVQLYAAMGQTDCTACGYDCKGYAMALVSGSEKDPNLCVPGADETAAKIKELLESSGTKG